MKCVIRINRKDVALSAEEINSILYTVKEMNITMDRYKVYPNVIKITIHSEIEADLCSRIEERMLKTFKRIIEKRREK